jgi:hypothetical protein
LQLKNEPKRPDLYNISLPKIAPVLYSAAIHPRAVATVEVLENQPFSLFGDNTVIPGHHSIKQTQVSFFMAADYRLVATKTLFHFLPVRPYYKQLEHGDEI